MTKNYKLLPDFALVYLEDSFVLGIEAVPGQVTFELNLVLVEEHPDYSAPKPDEVYCFRSSLMIFTGVSRLAWRDQGAPPATDAAGVIDFGNVDSMQVVGGGFSLTGSWGHMDLLAAGVHLELLSNKD